MGTEGRLRYSSTFLDPGARMGLWPVPCPSLFTPGNPKG